MARSGGFSPFACCTTGTTVLYRAGQADLFVVWRCTQKDVRRALALVRVWGRIGSRCQRCYQYPRERQTASFGLEQSNAGNSVEVSPSNGEAVHPATPCLKDTRAASCATLPYASKWSRTIIARSSRSRPAVGRCWQIFSKIVFQPCLLAHDSGQTRTASLQDRGLGLSPIELRCQRVASRIRTGVAGSTVPNTGPLYDGHHERHRADSNCRNLGCNQIPCHSATVPYHRAASRHSCRLFTGANGRGTIRTCGGRGRPRRISNPLP